MFHAMASLPHSLVGSILMLDWYDKIEYVSST